MRIRCCAAAWLLAGAVQAQGAERVDVTGSRLRPFETDNPTPVQVIDRETIRSTGAATLIELFAKVASLSAIAFVDTGGDGTFAPGASTITLRYMGMNAALVLLNGRRLSHYPLAHESATFTNVDSLPVDVIERVEILKAGGAALYGSDAVAGVINIVTRAGFRGMVAKASGQRSIDNGQFGSHSASLTGGWGDLAADGWNLMAHAEMFHRDRVHWRQVIGDVNPDYAARVPSLGSFSTFSFPGNLIGVGPVPGCPANLLINGLCMYDRYQRFDAVQKADREMGFVSGRLNLAAGHQAFGEASWARTQTRYEHPYAAYGPLGSQVWTQPSTAQVLQFDYLGLPATHPLNPTGQDGLELRYRFADSPSADVARTDQYRLLAGARGPLGGFSYEAAAGLAGGTTHLEQRGSFSAAGFRRQIGNWDPPDPDFFNRGYRIGGPNSAAVIDDLFPAYGYRGFTRTAWTDGLLKGAPLQGPAGPVQLAAGAELRHERYTVDPSQNLRQGDIVGNGLAASDGTRVHGALFSEADIPVATGLDAQAALRLDKFSRFDAHLSPKLAMRWRALPVLSLRGTLETGFRTPNLVESAASARYGYESGFTDAKRCAPARSLATDLRAAANALPANDPQRPVLLARADLVETGECLGSVASITSESRHLKPETSRSATFGLVLVPSRDMHLSMDWWHIARRNEITIEDLNEILVGEDSNPDHPVLRDPLAQDRTFTPAEQQRYGVAAGPIRSITHRYRNVGRTRSEGVDFAGRWQGPTPAGALTVTLDATWLRSLARWSEVRNGFGDNLSGHATIPRWVADVSATLTHAGLSHTLRGNYRRHTQLRFDFTDPTCTVSPVLPPDQCRLAAWVNWDYMLSYGGIAGFTFSAQVQNLANRRPPDVRFVSQLIPQDVRDVQGRMLRLGVEYRWK